ncbi:beta-galactoside alpha-2,6-sialyltransferase [Pycnococcus provasolii]
MAREAGRSPRTRLALAALAVLAVAVLFALHSFHVSHSAHKHFLEHHYASSEVGAASDSVATGSVAGLERARAQVGVSAGVESSNWESFQQRLVAARKEKMEADLKFLGMPVDPSASPAKLERTWERVVDEGAGENAAGGDAMAQMSDDRASSALEKLEADLVKSQEETENAREMAIIGSGLAAYEPPPPPRPPRLRVTAQQRHAAVAKPSHGPAAGRAHRPRSSLRSGGAGMETLSGGATCGGAPNPFDPLRPGGGGDTAQLTETLIEAVRRRRRRRLQAVEGVRNGAFSEAGRGGRYGVSCEPSAPVKARQACLERRFLKRCSEDDARAKAQKSARKPTADEQLLAKCIHSDFTDAQCSAPGAQERIRSAARALKGIQMVLDAKKPSRPNPSCLLYSKGKKCGEILSNEESSLTMGCGERGAGFPAAGCDRKLATGEKTVGGDNQIGQDFPLLRERDAVRDTYQTCAVVGNSMRLFDGSMPLHGSYVDRHDAVFRFNNELERIYHVLSLDTKGFGGEQRIIDEGGLEERVGFKTTFRLVNRKYTSQLLDGTDKIVRNGTKKVIPLTFSSTTLRPESGDERERPNSLLFWHYSSAPFVRTIQRKYKDQAGTIDLIAPEFANWLLDVFAQLRVDLLRIGLGPFTCYRSISSGIHGMMLAFLLCKEALSVFGFSVSTRNFADGFNHGRPSQSHSWDFETNLMKTLYAAGLVNVCHT